MSSIERCEKEYENLENEYVKCFNQDIYCCMNFDPYNFDEDKEKSLKKACMLIRDMINKKKNVFEYNWDDDVYDKNRDY